MELGEGQLHRLQDCLGFGVSGQKTAQGLVDPTSLGVAKMVLVMGGLLRAAHWQVEKGKTDFLGHGVEVSHLGIQVLREFRCFLKTLLLLIRALASQCHRERGVLL